LECPSIQFSVFMSIFNVHVNRMPFKGKTLSKEYNPGKFLPAFREKASLLNEQTSILLDTKGGLVRVTQIAGLIARRIVCRIREGETLLKGDRFGLIKFGSRLDVYLPKENTHVVSQIGDKVKAGESVLAHFYSLSKEE
jgi:phosphatidylserine decarboxylase